MYILSFFKANIISPLKIRKNTKPNYTSLKSHQAYLHKASKVIEVIIRTFTFYSTRKFFWINFRDLKLFRKKKRERETKKTTTETRYDRTWKFHKFVDLDITVKLFNSTFKVAEDVDDLHANHVNQTYAGFPSKYQTLASISWDTGILGALAALAVEHSWQNIWFDKTL